MTGFDPTAFLAGDPPPPVASHGDTSAAAGISAPPSENRDVWHAPEQSVATVAMICGLTGDKPHARDLNRVFGSAGSARFQGVAWERFCRGVHAFSDRHAAACLEAGWSAREIWAVGRDVFLTEEEAAHTFRALLSIGHAGLALAIGKREVLEIRPEWVLFKADKLGTLQRYYRAHNRINHDAARFGLLWEVPLF